jgi:microsomal dipeptidase-like Zn-dependent dipeptidase
MLLLGVLTTAPAARANGDRAVRAAATDQSQRPIVGYADLHNHQFAYLGFGGLLLWGAAYDPDGDISKALPWSDWTPANSGEVVDSAGNPVGLTGCPSLGLPKCSPTSPVLKGRCPPGTGTDIFHQCFGALVHGPGGLRDLLHLPSGHAVGGFPEFDGWPRWNILSGQQVYVDWLKRAHDGGLKLMVMHAVNSEMLCRLVDRIAAFGCDDMSAVDRQIHAAKALEAFVDAQSGGPGKGWYRIAYSGEQARQIINSGKLAVVLGIEVDSLFGCKKHSACTPDYVDRELQRYYDMGVRHVFPIHLTDNAFGGMALYNDLFDFGNKLVTGDWWDVTNCAAGSGINFHLDEVDKIRQPGFFDIKNQILRVLLGHITGLPPEPPAGSNCNSLGLTPLGEHLIRAMIAKRMIIDVDHSSARSLDRMLALAEQAHYPGIASGHTGLIETGTTTHVDGDEYKRHEGNKTDAQLERIRALGGVVAVILHQGKRSEIKQYHRPDGSTPVPFFCGNSSESWAQVYLAAAQRLRGGAVAIGSDFNGLAGEPAPRFGPDGPLSGEACNGDHPDAYVGPGRPQVSYPFTAFGTSARFDRMRIGNNTFDISFDGLGNVGMYPDFVEELRKVGVTDADLGPLFNSAEAYVRMWERADDQTPPTISCSAPDGAWHAADVAISCTAEDPASGLENPSDASFTLSTHVPDGIETADAATETKTICDTRDNCATAGPIGGNKIDKKPPSVTIIEPTASEYVHSATLTLDYSVSDGGSGVASTTARLDGSTTLAGHGLSSGQTINLLTELPLGPHTFEVRAVDGVGNPRAASITFTIIVTAASIRADVEQFLANGAIKNGGLAKSLLAKLDAAARARIAGHCSRARQLYEAFAHELRAQTGKGVNADAAAIMISDAQYLASHCP